MDWQELAKFRTLPELLQFVLNTYSNSFAFNYREAGYWRHLSTEEFCGSVRRFCLGLVELGMERGDRVGILASPSPFWLIADFAIMNAGGISVPLFPNVSEENLVYESKNSGLKFLVAIGDAQWQMAERNRKLFKKIITKAVSINDRHAIDFKGVMALGDKASEKDPHAYALLRDRVAINDTATIIHTSGSTGVPKGVVLTHGNLTSQIHGATKLFPLNPEGDRAFSALPLAHVFERMVMYTYLAQGTAVYFCDDVKNVGNLLRDIKPTIMTMVPRLIEKLHSRIKNQVEVGNTFKRALGRWAMNLASGEETMAKSFTRNLADAFVYRKMRDALGGQLKCLIVGGAALSNDLAQFLTNIGLPVYTGYGLTEASPVLAVNAPGSCKLGTVGKPFPGVDVRLDDKTKEILARGPNIMQGYYRNQEATDQTIDKDGWLHTGDLGEFDVDGFLKITGRIKELLKTSNGKYVSPVPIEQALAKSSSLIDQVMVVAEGRQFVTCLLFPDHDYLHKRKANDAKSGMTDEAFLQTPEICAEMEALLAQVNAGLNHWEQVRKYRFVLTPLAVERDDLTPTMKIRRHIVCEKYRHLIDEMYADDGYIEPVTSSKEAG